MPVVPFHPIIREITDSVKRTLIPKISQVVTAITRSTFENVVEVQNRIVEETATFIAREMSGEISSIIASSYRTKVSPSKYASIEKRILERELRRSREEIQGALVSAKFTGQPQVFRPSAETARLAKYATARRQIEQYSREFDLSELGDKFIEASPIKKKLSTFTPTSLETVGLQAESYGAIFSKNIKQTIRSEYITQLKNLLQRKLDLGEEEAYEKAKSIVSRLGSSLTEATNVALELYKRNLLGKIAPNTIAVKTVQEGHIERITTRAGQAYELGAEELAVKFDEFLIESLNEVVQSVEREILRGKVPKSGLARGLNVGAGGKLAPKSEKLQRLLSQPKFANLRQKLLEVEPGIFNVGELSTLKIEDIYGGVTRVNIGYIDDITGATRRLTFAVDNYGRVLTDTSSRFRGFIDGLRRDIKEFTKWSLAIMAVYTPLNLMNSALQTSIEQQTLLADILITLNKEEDYSNKVFDEASKVALRTGQSLKGVLEGYNLAARAAGEIADTNKRVAVSTKLMEDSLILAKLANIDQAGATDTLVASLRQMGLGLDQGQVLLDKWTRVSKIANVDVNTLATSFAIVGEAAKQAGLNIDELNGLIATVAASGITSAKETGNAVRAIISGVTADRTAKELAKYGIAVTDVAGKMRDFNSIVADIKRAFDAGLISPDQLNKLAYVIGGGNRRQAQVVAALVQWKDVGRIAGESAMAAGDAWQAFAKRLDTVQTETTNLKTAFDMTARTLFSSGGLLDGMSTALQITTELVKAINGLVKVLGTAAPALIGTFGAIGLLGKERVAVNMGKVAEKSLVGIGKAASRVGLMEFGINTMFTAEAIGHKVTANWSKVAAAGTAIAMAILEGLKSKSAVSAGTVLAGGILGGLVSGWNPVGILIGSSIAEAFANAVENTKIELKNAEVPEEVIKAAGGSFAVAISQAAMNIGKFGGKILGIPWLENIDASTVAMILAARNKGADWVAKQMSGSKYSLQMGFSPSLSGASGLLDKNIISKVTQQQKSLIESLYYRSNPKLSGREMTQAKGNLEGLSSVLERYLVLIKQAGLSTSELGVNNLEEFAQLIARIQTLADTDRLDELNSRLTETISLLDKLSTGSETVKVFDQITESFIEIPRDKAQQRVQELTEEITKLLKTTSIQISAKIANMPQINIMSELVKSDIDVALKYTDEFIQQLLANLNEAQKAAIMQQAETAEELIRLGDKSMIRLTGLQAMFFGQGLQLAQKEGAIGAGSSLGIRKLDLNEQQLNELLVKTESLYQMLNRMFGYSAEKKSEIVKLADNQWKKITTDSAIFNMLLEEIAGNTSKQLEGIYNLPSGAEFFVPWQAAVMAMSSGTTSAISSAADTVANAVQEAANQQATAVNNLKDTMANLYQTYIDRWQTSRVYPPETQQDRANQAWAERYKGLGEYWQNRANRAWADRYKGLGEYWMDKFANPSLEDYKRHPDWYNQYNPPSKYIYGAVPQAAQPVAQQNLRLSLTSQIHLTLDGRTLAQVIRHYMAQETFRFSNTQSTITRQVAI